MNPIDLVQEYFDVSDNEAHDILWNKTCFPFGDEDDIRKNLRHVKKMEYQYPFYAKCDMCGWPLYADEPFCDQCNTEYSLLNGRKI